MLRPAEHGMLDFYLRWLPYGGSSDEEAYTTFGFDGAHLRARVAALARMWLCRDITADDRTVLEQIWAATNADIDGQLIPPPRPPTRSRRSHAHHRPSTERYVDSMRKRPEPVRTTDFLRALMKARANDHSDHLADDHNGLERTRNHQSTHTEYWDWQTQANCRDQTSTSFFPPENERGARRRQRESAAKQICSECPVINQCLDHALARPEPHGVWGATTPGEREQLRQTDQRNVQMCN